ncbi:hypothetical protein DBR47_17380 [Paucibacter sp. KBW04]|uniref:hypothetical protein n=1 Tax=Paucibacter sp. KBW04 TaxID=2153361 RepID=UPI000F56EC7C|nr:hypothetical protein [Paucibacter sp. KBW04]RQO56307.1 hypothetical protein DBR47_17380 [Paucibacter sp. KBW04]
MYVLKLLVVILCYAMSGTGMLLMFFGGISAVSFAGGQSLLLFWPAALIAHIYLSLAWIESRTLGRRAACTAGALGIAGLLAFPVLLQISGKETLTPWQFLKFAALELLAVLPAMLLALYLSWYHSRRKSGQATH